jgi:lipid-A-disaccharide synthase
VSKRIFISAGEESGDTHAAGLVSELLKINPDWTFRGLGGDRLEALGVKIDFHVSELSTMGFIEVLKRYPFFRRVYRRTAARLKKDPPDFAVLVDYPGMNFRFADLLNSLGVQLVYYVLPQVWAWHVGRVKRMRSWNAKFVSILPFEPDFFSQHGLKVEYFGHPLIENAVPSMSPQDFRDQHGIRPNERLIAVLPGSRTHEIERNLPVMLEGLELAQIQVGEIRAICRPAHSSQSGLIDTISKPYGIDLKRHDGSLYDLLGAADLTLVVSGTATVDTALCKSPAIVIYKISPLTYAIARWLVRVPNVAMANLIAGASVYPELIQRDANPGRLSSEIAAILRDKELISEMRSRISTVSELLGERGAYEKAARFFSSVVEGESRF